jgi:hypothetical protein
VVVAALCTNGDAGRKRAFLPNAPLLQVGAFGSSSTVRCYWIRLFTSLPWHSHSCRYRQSDACWLVTKIADRASVHFMHFHVKGTLCENRQLIQRTLVTFPPRSTRFVPAFPGAKAGRLLWRFDSHLLGTWVRNIRARKYLFS